MLKRIDEEQSIITEKVIATNVSNRVGNKTLDWYYVLFGYEFDKNNTLKGVKCHIQFDTKEAGQYYANYIMNGKYDYSNYNSLVNGTGAFIHCQTI